MMRKRTPFNSIGQILVIVAIVGVLVLLLLSLKQPAVNPLPQVTTPLAGEITPGVTATTAVANGADETTGIILAGAFLVLIVLGGTIGATRRKP